MRRLRAYLDTSVLNFLLTVVNQTMGYQYPLRLTTPLELMNDED